jgi:type II secretory pathway pseudopilin PulG
MSELRMKPFKSLSAYSARPSFAFTLLELVVVVGILAVLGLMLIPALTSTGPNVTALQCMNNSKRLAAAWHMYADDRRDMLVYASEDGTGTFNPLNPFAWACLSSAESLPPYSCITDTNADIVKRPLWAYTGKDATCFRCPADHTGLTINGNRVLLVRTYLMNVYLGGYAGTAPVASQRLFLKLADLTSPGPAKTFVFLDGRLNVAFGNSSFLTDMTGFPNQPSQYQFSSDFPAANHNFGCGFAFADGHAVIHPWSDPRTYAPTSSLYQPYYPSPRNQDIAWLQDHSTRPK